jgi:hypothetical protein
MDAALDEIESQRGTGLDAEVVDACVLICRKEGYQIEA